ncbi:transglycosylase domain-containing protein [Nocardioides sp. SYSU DS0663]|uniref:transglycosylase domain-containing protein n=1 Tax=Nocardioides sp. SYSU DS0663 TaxID=3416445 RepID=UPI003F4C6B6D
MRDAKRRAVGPAVKTSPKRPPRTPKQVVGRVARWLLALGLVGALLVGAGLVVLYQVIDIPNPNEDFRTETTFVFYEDGKTELGRFATQNRVSIDLEKMPQTMKDAVVAAENDSFWTDSGIDPKGIVRAAFNNAQGNDRQGASTITQQYVKILYLTQEQSYKRKIKEAILSLKVQRQQSKSRILEGYLNTIYFGRGAYGVEAAAQAYFQRPAKNLDLRQSAVLASVLNNPSRFDPANGKGAREDLLERYRYTLGRMAELEMITDEKAEKASRRLPKFPPEVEQSTYGGQKGHMLEMVRKELERLGFSDSEIKGGGLKVTTTFTKKAMEAAEQAVVEERPEGFGDKDLHVGVASVEPGTGAVRGFYGGQDYLQSEINWAVAGGQAGSTLKAFALAAAIKEGFSLTDTFDGNSPYVLPDGTEITNQGDDDWGSSISMVYATQKSANSAFVDMTMSMDEGPEKIVKTMNDMGIPPAEPKGRNAAGFPNFSDGLDPVATVALGSATVSPINMATAYATIANEGVYAPPFIIEKVVDDSGEVRYDHNEVAAEPERVLDADIAADVSYALQQNVTGGSGTAALALGRPAAGKTGTATNGRDEVSSAWFAGYTPQMATAVMYVRGKGNEQLQGWLPEYFGGSYPARTWTNLMGTLMEGLPVEQFPEPAYVDGDAPSGGHEPYVAPPSPTRNPQPTRKPPSQQPSKTPEPSITSEPEPTSSPTPTQQPSPSCDILGCGESPSPTSQPSPTQQPSPTSSPTSGTTGGPGGGGGGAGGGNGRGPGTED